MIIINIINDISVIVFILDISIIVIIHVVVNFKIHNIV